MADKIEIKAWFGDWHECDAEKAKAFCDHMMDGFTAISDREERIKIINEKHLRGITYEELLQL